MCFIVTGKIVFDAVYLVCYLVITALDAVQKPGNIGNRALIPAKFSPIAVAVTSERSDTAEMQVIAAHFQHL